MGVASGRLAAQIEVAMRLSSLLRLPRSVAREVERDHLALLAAGVAFFGFLALFPMFAALVAIYGLVFDPTEVERQMGQLRGVMPGEAHTLMAQQLSRLADEAPRSLSIGMVVALLFALWSASKGSRGIIKAINVTFDQEETRGFVRLNLVSLLLTAGGIVFFMVVIALAAFLPSALQWAGLGEERHGWIALARWPVLLVIVTVAVSAVYALAPDRQGRPRRRFVTAGSVLASLGLVIASAFFSLYVSRFGDYNEVYGSLGAVAVFLLWLYIAAFVVLLGAEVDAEIERHPQWVGRAPSGSEPLSGSEERSGTGTEERAAFGARS